MFFYEEILREFQNQKVKYVIVGGTAFNLLGGLRNTYDLDILVEMSDKNLAKVVKILKKKRYKVKQPVDPAGIVDKAIREDWIRNKGMKAFNFYKDDEMKEVDIIIKSPLSFKQARRTAERLRSGNIALYVISIDNLIKMKSSTGRDVDKLDIKQLKKIKELRKLK